MRSSLNQRITDLIGIPLQTKMIADIFFEKLGSNNLFEMENIGSIADLYKKFVEKKIKIGYEEKKLHSIIDDTGLFKIVEKTFYDDHINLSMRFFFKKTEIKIQSKKVDIQAYGLIVDFRDETPIFLHQSFAEYFLALNAVEKIKESKVNTPVEQLCLGYPEEVATFMSYCRNLGFDEAPNYAYLRRLFKELYNKCCFEHDFVYDWTI